MTANYFVKEESGDGGSSYSIREMETFMNEAGFVDSECRQMGPPSPFMLLTGYKR